MNELAAASGLGVKLDGGAIPLRPEVRGAYELLGLDPLYGANERKLAAIAPPDDAERALAAMRAHPLGKNAAIIGQITADHTGMVVLRSVVGGEQMPRIC